MADSPSLQQPPPPPLEQDEILILKVEEDYCWEEEPSVETEDPSPETFCQLFRLFCYQKVAGPREALRRSGSSAAAGCGLSCAPRSRSWSCWCWSSS